MFIRNNFRWWIGIIVVTCSILSIAGDKQSNKIKLASVGENIGEIGRYGDYHTVEADYICMDQRNNFYIEDVANMKIIKVSQDGKFIMEIKFLSSNDNAPRIVNLASLAIDTAGDIYCIDQRPAGRPNKPERDHIYIFKYNSKGEFLYYIGPDGKGEKTFFKGEDFKLATDEKDNLYVYQPYSNETVSVFNKDGKKIGDAPSIYFDVAGNYFKRISYEEKYSDNLKTDFLWRKEKYGVYEQKGKEIGNFIIEWTKDNVDSKALEDIIKYRSDVYFRFVDGTMRKYDTSGKVIKELRIPKESFPKPPEDVSDYRTELISSPSDEFYLIEITNEGIFANKIIPIEVKK